MIENVQIIKEKGKPRFAVIEYGTFQKIEEQIEDALDVREAEKVLNDPKTSWRDFSEVKQRLMVNPIREKRKELGLSQKELAGRLKVHQSYISKIERPQYNPSKKTLLKVAKALECQPEELF